MLHLLFRFALLSVILFSVLHKNLKTHKNFTKMDSSVCVLPKELYKVLELKNLEKCSIELALDDDSIKHALGKVSDVMVELHMTFVQIGRASCRERVYVLV